jgi:hypothetical protein
MRPRWSHHGLEGDDPVHPPSVLPPVPLVLNKSRLGGKREDQFVRGLELIGAPKTEAELEARLKQRPDDWRDSLDVPDDELFVTRPGWVEEQDARYVAQSQKVWSDMRPSEIAREGYMKMQAGAGHIHHDKPRGRSAQRKAEAEARRRRKQGNNSSSSLYPQPTDKDLEALRNK